MAILQRRLNIQHEGTGNPVRRRRHVIFLCDPTAHHSALLCFRELVAQEEPRAATGQDGSTNTRTVTFEVIELGVDDRTCTVDVAQLENELQKCANRSLKDDSVLSSSCLPADAQNPEILPIVVLNAGSNVTGVQLDVSRINILIHTYNGIACWDFAAVSSHGKIDVNPAMETDSTATECRNAASTDVAFFSPHKLLGGPGASGFLVIKKRLLQNPVPSVPGGGVVFYVSRGAHAYIHNVEEREEGGTPSILGDIRCGLVYRLHTLLPHHHISAREDKFSDYLRRQWASHPRYVFRYRATV